MRPGSFVVAFVDAVYTVCQILKEQDEPSASAWKHGHPGGWLLLVSGALGLVGTLLVFVGFDRIVKRTAQNDELYEGARGIWALTVEYLGVGMESVGVHVFDVRGIKGFRFLRRRAMFVVRPRRRASNIIWRQGKGAVGIAWAEDETIIANVAALAKRARTERGFCQIPRRERFGLGRREFRRSQQYKAILAAPLRGRGGKVLGCLSVDLLVDGHAEKLDTLAREESFNNVLAVCEAVLAKRG